MHHSHDSIVNAIEADEARQRAVPRQTSRPIVGMVAIDLEAGDSAWDPSSTKRDIHGPFRVIYRRFPDGGIDAETQPLASVRSNHWTPPAFDVNLPDGSVRHTVIGGASKVYGSDSDGYYTPEARP